MALNRQGKKVERLQDADDIRTDAEEPTYRSEEDSITRFDQAKRRKARRPQQQGPRRTGTSRRTERTDTAGVRRGEPPAA